MCMKPIERRQIQNDRQTRAASWVLLSLFCCFSVWLWLREATIEDVNPPRSLVALTAALANVCSRWRPRRRRARRLPSACVHEDGVLKIVDVVVVGFVFFLVFVFVVVFVVVVVREDARRK